MLEIYDGVGAWCGKRCRFYGKYAVRWGWSGGAGLVGWGGVGWRGSRVVGSPTSNELPVLIVWGAAAG